MTVGFPVGASVAAGLTLGEPTMRELAENDQRIAWRRFFMDLPLPDSLRVHLAVCRGCSDGEGPCIGPASL